MTGITASITTCNSFPLETAHAAGESDLHTAAEPRVPNCVFWRKQLILRRSALEVQWHQTFPCHSFSDLRLISPPNRADSYWEGEDWKRAARAYHDDRKKGARL
jgi:hypothetical protein